MLIVVRIAHFVKLKGLFFDGERVGGERRVVFGRRLIRKVRVDRSDHRAGLEHVLILVVGSVFHVRLVETNQLVQEILKLILLAVEVDGVKVGGRFVVKCNEQIKLGLELNIVH